MKRVACVLLAVTAAFLLGGCGSSEGESYDPDQIAVKQPGNGPPPMNAPMNEGVKNGSQ